PLPLGDVLRIGAQIADALDRAHRAGIVHRDLKPGNIMLTKSGAKLLDFGLAKTVHEEVNPDGETQHLEKALTQEGTILGTFQYMAPEQLEAEQADTRTDIFALGAVLYEMATGRRAFNGKTKTSLIAAIVGSQPQALSEVVPLTPPALEHVIQKCLEKERDDRWQSAHDVAQELKWIATIPAEQKARTGRAAKIATAAAVLLGLALAGVTAMWLRARSAPKPRTAFAVLPPKGFVFRAHLLSPDGTAIVFGSATERTEGGLWVRRVDQVEAKRLTNDPEDHAVAFSPDSKWIAFVSSRQLKRISVDGGTAEVVSSHVKAASGGAWAPDGTIVLNMGWGQGLVAVRQDGAEPVAVTTLDAKRRESFHGWPEFLDDGNRFLYLVHTIAEQKNEIWAASLDGKTKKLLVRADGLVGTSGRDLYFTRDGAVYAQELDQDALKLEGEPRRVIERVGFFESDSYAGAAVAGGGELLYYPQSNMERRVEVAWYDRGGRRIEKLFDEVSMVGVELSLDGRKVVGQKLDPAKGAHDIFVIDLARGTRSRVTSGLSNHINPQFSRDGTRVFYTSDSDGVYDIYVQSEDGTTPPVPVWKGGNDDKTLEDVSPADDSVLATAWDPKTQSDLFLISPKNERRPFIVTEASEFEAEFSPDGKWVGYVSDRSGRYEAYVRPLEGGRSVQVSTNGASGFAWSADGREMLIRTLDNARVAVPLTFSGDTAVPGTPVPMFTAPARDYYIIAETPKGLLISTIPDPSDYVQMLYYDSAPRR
ncbi:MAG TPA: protein kinase, partial [Thermoanaerobaculia bacterium]|nr:protein kinase [Thermoanaerobaculia bacterium]